MKNRSHHKRLLAEVLADAGPADFRDEMLRQTLSCVRRRKRFRHARQGGVVLMLAAGLCFGLLKHNRSPAPLTLQLPPASACTLVNSRPLSPARIIETQIGGASMVASAPGPMAPIETYASASVARELNDQELLSLLAGRPGALVREPGGNTELVLLNPADWDGFYVSK